MFLWTVQICRTRTRVIIAYFSIPVNNNPHTSRQKNSAGSPANTFRIMFKKRFITRLTSPELFGETRRPQPRQERKSQNFHAGFCQEFFFFFRISSIIQILHIYIKPDSNSLLQRVILIFHIVFHVHTLFDFQCFRMFLPFIAVLHIFFSTQSSQVTTLHNFFFPKIFHLFFILPVCLIKIIPIQLLCRQV